ncbi:MAG: 16S rRNA (adenine(1518)-N(6)/adenine(1519)-N(6))-dimethyltransferase RsmA [Candidatus Saccharimonadales bacterium]
MPKKELGQHWLTDRLVLEAIVDCALPRQQLPMATKQAVEQPLGAGSVRREFTSQGTRGGFASPSIVVEIGPGQGALTSVLLARAERVIAVEYDADLARKLLGQFPGKNLEVVHQDILSYDFTGLPDDFIVVGNIPYYITNKIVRKVSEGPIRPKIAVLLVQKEVAERLAAGPGQMSLLSLSAQVFHDVSLGPVVLRDKFTPPPKVDSQVVILRRRDQPLVPTDQQKAFFRLAHAGFAERRKKLRSSLAAGLAISKTDAGALLQKANISPDARAQELSIEQWQTLTNLS